MAKLAQVLEVAQHILEHGSLSVTAAVEDVRVEPVTRHHADLALSHFLLFIVRPYDHLPIRKLLVKHKGLARNDAFLDRARRSQLGRYTMESG